MGELIDTGLVIARRARIIVPSSVGRKMLSIYNLLENQSNEFGIYLKGRWEPDREGGPAVVVDADAHYLPEQHTSPAFITFTEEPPDPSWNVVAHRHPPGCRGFSGNDEASINREFLASFLYLPAWEFPDAIVNVPLAVGVKLQVKADVEIAGDMLSEMGYLRDLTKSRINPPWPRVVGPPLPDAGLEAALPLTGTFAFDPEGAATAVGTPAGSLLARAGMGVVEPAD